MEIRIMTQSPHSEILNCLNTHPLGVPFSIVLPTCALEGLTEKLQIAHHTARMPCGRQSIQKTTSLAFKTNMERYYAGLFWEMREHDGCCVCVCVGGSCWPGSGDSLGGHLWASAGWVAFRHSFIITYQCGWFLDISIHLSVVKISTKYFILVVV